jgi:Zn-dependent protease with chaperone function
LGTPEADRFTELRPFYQLCGLGLLLTALNFALVLWLLGGAVTAGVCTVGALALGWRWQRSQQRELEQRLARASASERPRLKTRLDALRVRLRQFAGDAAAHLVLVPDPAVVLATVRSRRAPLVEMTAGFWTTYADAPDLVEAALAHEAGHVAARDVELFQRMLGMIRGLVYALPLLNLLLPLAFAALALREQGWSWDGLRTLDGGTLLRMWGRLLGMGLQFTVPMAAGPALAVSFAWSALLLARELQADAFAVAVLGSERPVRALLETQLQRRQQQAPQRSLPRRLVTWLIQPALRWRSTLPALQGQLGPRIELLLGIASGGFLLSSVGTAFFLALHRGGRGQAVWMLLVTLGVLSWLWWISYALFWGRSRLEADRGARGLLSGVGSVLRFSLAQLSVLALWMLMQWGEGGGPWRDSGPWVLASLLATAFALWAAGKLALCSEAERQRRRPRLLPGLGGLLAVVVAALSLRSGLGLLRDAAPRPEQVSQGLSLLGPAAALLASLLLGMLGHLFRPYAADSPQR